MPDQDGERTTNEQIGGYRSDLPFVLDWEMWCRIAAASVWGFTPEPGASYRRHHGSETDRLARLGKTLEDLLQGGQIARSHFSPESRRQTERTFLRHFTNHVFSSVLAKVASHEFRDAAHLLHKYRAQAFAGDLRLRWLRLRSIVGLKQLRSTVTQ